MYKQTHCTHGYEHMGTNEQKQEKQKHTTLHSSIEIYCVQNISKSTCSFQLIGYGLYERLTMEKKLSQY